jgi:hypothetical protein
MKIDHRPFYVWTKTRKDGARVYLDLAGFWVTALTPDCIVMDSTGTYVHEMAKFYECEAMLVTVDLHLVAPPKRG